MIGDLVGAEGGSATGGATCVGTEGSAEGLMASAPGEILRGRRLIGSLAMDATSCGLVVDGAGHGVGLEASPGAGRGKAAGALSAMDTGPGSGECGGEGGSETADSLVSGGIDAAAIGEPAVCGGVVASSIAGETGSK